MNECDTGMGTSAGMWQMLSEIIDGDKIPISLDKAIIGLCEGKLFVCSRISDTAENALPSSDDSDPQRMENGKGIGRGVPTLIGDVVEADCVELRDIAEWFKSRGKPMQAEFLRKVADRHEVIFGAYWTATTRESSVAT